MRAVGRLALVALAALGLEGCASAVMDYDKTPMPRERGQVRVENDSHQPVQCAPYARTHSGIKIYGDAYTWWDKAAGQYPRGSLPEEGAVMVLSNYAGATRAHVAVVRQLVSHREIRVDHANWLDDGSIYVNDPVEDVSDANDWSVVRVFNLKTGYWGAKLYPVQGFIGSDSDSPSDVAAPAGQTRPVAQGNAPTPGATAMASR